MTVTSLTPSSSRGRLGEVEATVVGQGDEAQLEAPLGGEHLPRHDVGVVLHLGADHDVARAQVGPAPGVGHQVDALGGVLGEHHLGGGGGTDEAGDAARAAS